MLEAHVEVEHGSIHRGDWFVSTSVKTVEIATALENLEANLKGSTCPNGEKSMAWEHIAQQESEKRP
jgi:hypothetical protein